MGKFIDLTGQCFGRLTVVEYTPGHRGNRGKWRCCCDCGTIVEILTSDLKGGHSKSCGCLMREIARSHQYRHGQYGTRLYSIWNNMKMRCYNPNDSGYGIYGSRGITVCEEWRKSFEAFRDWAMANGYDDTLSVDRIDVNGPYSPENCRWTTMKEQQRNRRNNVLISFDNKTQCMSAWAEKTGISTKVIHWRLSHGWSVEKTLTTPVRTTRTHSK